MIVGSPPLEMFLKPLTFGHRQRCFCPMRQGSTQPEKQALAFAAARVSGKKYKFLKVPFYDILSVIFYNCLPLGDVKIMIL